MEKSKRNIYLKMKMLPEAREIWESLTGALRTAKSRSTAASGLGRVTSGPIIALRSVPHYHGAAMDGYAVCAGDTYGASDTTPIRLRVGQDAHAVDTGDPLPDGADAVIMIEHVERVSDSEIEIRSAAFPWQHVRKVGEDIVSGRVAFTSAACFAACRCRIASGGRHFDCKRFRQTESCYPAHRKRNHSGQQSG